MDSVALTLRLIDAFENAGVPYMLSGVIASSYYGAPNMKHRAQFVAQISSDQLTAVIKALGEDFQLDPQMSIDSTTMTMRHVLEHAPSRFVFDIFLLGADAHDKMRFERRRELPFEGTRVCMPTPEDVVISDLRWAGTTQQVKLPARKLDLPYIRQWTDIHGTRKSFERLLQETP